MYKEDPTVLHSGRVPSVDFSMDRNSRGWQLSFIAAPQPVYVFDQPTHVQSWPASIGGGRSINLGRRNSSGREYKTGGGRPLIYFSLSIFFLLQLNAARFQNSMRPRYRLLNARRKHFNDCYTYQLREYSKKCFPLLISCNEIFGYGGQIYCISHSL